jgi:hypothetical protein
VELSSDFNENSDNPLTMDKPPITEHHNKHIGFMRDSKNPITINSIPIHPIYSDMVFLILFFILFSFYLVGSMHFHVGLTLLASF